MNLNFMEDDMAENIIAGVMICFVAFIMIGIGISQIRSKIPTGVLCGRAATEGGGTI